jgi:hypothetical protein
VNREGRKKAWLAGSGLVVVWGERVVVGCGLLTSSVGFVERGIREKEWDFIFGVWWRWKRKVVVVVDEQKQKTQREREREEGMWLCGG